MKTEYIVGIGELLWDVLPDGRRLGGAPANFAYHVSQFGLKSVVVSAVGRDEAGDAAVRELEAMSTHPFPDSESDRSDGSWYSAESGLPVKSVSSWLVSGGFYTLIDKVDSPTGTVDIRLDAAGVPQYDIRMPVAWDSISWTPALRQLASRTELCASELSPAAVLCQDVLFPNLSMRFPVWKDIGVYSISIFASSSMAVTLSSML